MSARTPTEDMVGSRPSRLTRTLLIASVVIFAVSLCLDAFYTAQEDPRSWSLGFGLLLLGWLAMFDGVFAWLANPMLLTSWVLLLLRRPRGMWALGCAVIALAIALSFLLVDDLMVNEAGGRAAVTRYGPGYWVWMASMLAACLAAVLKPRWAPAAIPVAQIAPAQPTPERDVKSE